MATSPAAADVSRADRGRVTTIAVAAATLGLAGSVIATLFGQAGSVIAIGLAALAVIPVAIWRVNWLPAGLMAVAATGIDRFTSNASDDPLSHIPMYRSLSDGLGLSGLYVNPLEILIVGCVLVWVLRAGAERTLRLPRTPLAAGMGVLLVIAVITEVRGLAQGGDLQASLYELRPWLYLAVLYVLVSQLRAGPGMGNAILWGMTLGTGMKAIIGTERYLTIGAVYPRPDSLLEHDESVFFVAFIVMTMALWAFRAAGPLRWVTAGLLPFVFIAMVGNNRRTAWIILPVALIAFAIAAWVRSPERRRRIAGITAALAAIGLGYVVAFHASESSLAVPAHSAWSQFQPNSRDAASNQYRVIETRNLSLDIKASPVLGLGFGTVIPNPIPNFVDASNIDPLIKYIPHNNVLYQWVRMGGVGAVVFWWTIGAATIAACKLSRIREQDPLTTVVATLTIAVIAGYLIQGWYDMGLTSFRITLLVGCLVGAVEAALTPRPLPERKPELVFRPRLSPALSPQPRWSQPQ